MKQNDEDDEQNAHGQNVWHEKIKQVRFQHPLYNRLHVLTIFKRKQKHRFLFLLSQINHNTALFILFVQESTDIRT